MFKKVAKVSILVAGVIANMVAIVSGSQGISYTAIGEACDHSSFEHHNMLYPTETSNGHVEYWCCCKCHKSYRDEDMTDLIENTDSNPTDPYDGRCIRNDGIVTTSLVEGDVFENTLPPNMPEIPEGYTNLYCTHDDVSQRIAIGFNNVNITAYQEISFLVHDCRGYGNIFLTYSSDRDYISNNNGPASNQSKVIIHTWNNYSSYYWCEIKLIYNSITTKYDIYYTWQGDSSVNKNTNKTVNNNLNELDIWYDANKYADWVERDKAMLYMSEVRGVLKAS